jgi:hypothetical protein
MPYTSNVPNKVDVTLSILGLGGEFPGKEARRQGTQRRTWSEDVE